MAASQPSFNLFKILLSVAALVIVLIGISLSAFILNPVLIAMFLAVLIRPFYQWLINKRVPSGLAMLLTVIGILLVGAALILFVTLSFRQLAVGVSGYSEQIANNMAELSGVLTSMGLGSFSLVESEMLSMVLLRFASSIAGLFATAVLILLMILFAIAEAPQFSQRIRDSLGVDSGMWMRTKSFVDSIVTYFLLRTRVNLVTGTLVFVLLLVLGVDYAALWGVLTFFLSYVPYVGIFLATVPSVILAFAEGGIVGAALVVLGVTVINATAENVFAPSIMGRGLSLSPLLIFVSFIFWTWLLGVPGTMIAMPITVALVLLLDAFDDTRWLARLCGFGGLAPDKGDKDPDDQALTTRA